MIRPLLHYPLPVAALVTELVRRMSEIAEDPAFDALIVEGYPVPHDDGPINWCVRELYLVHDDFDGMPKGIREHVVRRAWEAFCVSRGSTEDRQRIAIRSLVIVAGYTRNEAVWLGLVPGPSLTPEPLRAEPRHHRGAEAPKEIRRPFPLLLLREGRADPSPPA